MALPVLHLLATVIILFSATMLVPLGVAVYYWDAALHAYDESLAITLAAGVLLWLSTRRHARELQTRDGFLLVVLVWATLPVFGALPLMLFMPELGFTQSYFEAVSGLTTTGATILTGLDALPPSINIWRGFMQWLGGMGIIVLAVAILPLLRVGGRQIYRAETPGPMKDTKLTPRIRETAKWLWIVYAAITAACVIAYRIAGMSWLDAFMHAFTTMSLGGFSTHDASFGYFDSPAIEAVSIVFMIVAGINFASHFLALRERSANAYRRDPEARWFVLGVTGSALFIALFLWQHGVYPDFLSALRFAAFNTVSIATTTGYASTDYNLWPVFAPLLMLLLASTMSSAGSTGGGIKMIRTQLLVMQVWREMGKLVHPQAQLPVRMRGNVVPNQVVFAVLAYMSLYGVSLTLMTLILLATGLDLVTAFSAIVASITCTGPGLGEVGPAANFASLSAFQLWVCAIAMLLGRLELFTVFVLFTPAFWRK
jgi:trk system potassium uptake protein